MTSTWLASAISSSDREYTSIEAGRSCINGSVSLIITYGDGQVVGVESRVEFNKSIDRVISGKEQVFSNVTGQFDFDGVVSFTHQEFYAGENGVTVTDGDHYMLFFPGGYAGQNLVHVLDYNTNSTSTVNVYCQPISLAYRPGYEREDDTIVGHCTLNSTLMLVPYFELCIQNGKWTDCSRGGRYSDPEHPVAINDLTNSVILKYESDSDAYTRRLYFGNGDTLHEIDLGNPGAGTYALLNGNHIHHLVPAFNSTFSGLRVVYYGGNGTGYFHQYFLPALGFIGPIFHTDYVAFNSFDLSYLVTFANHNTLRIIRQGGKSKQHTLSVTLDNPNQCRNMAGQSGHYLICLADNGFCSVIISITATITTEQVTSQTIPVVSTKIVRIQVIAANTFYLLTEEREMLLYMMNSEVAYLGHYVVRNGIDFIVNSATSGIVCKTPNLGHSDYTLVIIFCVIFGSLLLLLLLGIFTWVVIYIARRRRLPTVPVQVDERTDVVQIEITNFDHGDKNDSGSNSTNTLLPEPIKSTEVSTASTHSLMMVSEYDNRINEREDCYGDFNPNIKPNEDIKPFESSAKSCGIEKFECESSNPVAFVENESIREPVTTTKDHQLTPASDVHREQIN